MEKIPDTYTPFKRTPEFTETTIPAGLLNAHKTRTGIWAKIVVVAGELDYHIIEPEEKVIRLTPDTPGIIVPSMEHNVEAVGPVQFYVEFYNEAGI